MTSHRERSAAPSGPVAIGAILTRLLARTGYAGEQAGAALATAWRQAAPAAFRDAARPGLVRRGVLEVFVSHSALVQEFGFHKASVLARLAELLPGAGITDIRCRLLADGRGT